MTTTTVAVPVRAASTDARPIIPRNRTNLWIAAEKVRDEVYERLAAACAREGIEPLLLKSGPNVFPAWVRFESWRPQGDRAVTERSSALITIAPKPYHAHEFEYEVTYNAGDKARTAKRVAEMGEAEVQSLVQHLVNRGPKPKFSRFREGALQFWRQKNEVESLRTDWLASVASLLLIAGFALLVLLPLALVLMGIAIYLYVKIARRKTLVRNEGKPDSEPRSLVRVDSWQTVLFNLGSEDAMVRDRFLKALQTGSREHCKFQPERVWYWGLDGKEEREQWVLTSNRAIVFCQIYRYGEDLYVGWDGHLNRGQWVEQTVASGIDRATGHAMTVTRVVPGTQATSEYDLSDLSCLMEWGHAQVVNLLKQLMAERKIEQEIDFKIQRAERRDVVASGAAAPDGGTVSKVRKMFQRTA